MDLEELMRALQSTQQQKSSVRLSERNVVELVNKLKQLGYLGDDLLYTINGKEYITTDRLRADIQDGLKQSGGRLELVELPALVGVDLVHCERQVGVRSRKQLVSFSLLSASHILTGWIFIMAKTNSNSRTASAVCSCLTTLFCNHRQLLLLRVQEAPSLKPRGSSLPTSTLNPSRQRSTIFCRQVRSPYS
jgi:hypothetical protein